jgi:hypothetical protein
MMTNLDSLSPFFFLILSRKLQETQMSTTSKLEEAEHKLQTLQTGLMFATLFEATWEVGEHGWSRGQPLYYLLLLGILQLGALSPHN